MFPESSTPNPCQTHKSLIPHSAIPAIPIRHTVPYTALIPREPPRHTLFTSANVLQCRDKNLFSFLHLFTPAYPAPPLSHSAGAPMSPEDGAPKPITPRRTAFAILFTMRPTSTRSLLPSSSRGLNPRSPFSLPLHFVCLFPQLPHIQKQSHQIPIHPIPRLHCTPSTAYARMGGWKGPFRLLSNLPFQRAILSRRTIPIHLPP